MPVAVTRVTTTGQIGLPKQFREILGVKPHDQVALLSDGERVELVPVHEPTLQLGTREEFLARVAGAEEDYREHRCVDAMDHVRELRAKYGL
ncbi:AbrB/MazE/SpoVT family DNA-binding domain-containing protein [Olsenella sp. YH-ols2217]|uniref:AbrB/MazE/SpoVT family DNA-binding domain-containing protein n=1 Tax=Kribbibacterium absianum TaxID=3044210 RepID=A0ABT6ZJC9_9ACTN|nr:MULTISPECIES: AbrB/MazE/SpoVT family DNA-binding domain-containing protein [unclassified Olsenella]MDJ1122715.1 AbrB/MazE/SpoVT family DNA-binding domain-containing protein [Olsenella sp. YH-ols2216]MDJ1129153.1 AbrB/MazE/SpoVT family DNA-binding domain-containing protein [Olsenella sp. YH-ols2217]